MRLQNTAFRITTRTKQIDTEIQALEASEARELLGIVQRYLPQNYVESDYKLLSVLREDGSEVRDCECGRGGYSWTG